METPASELTPAKPGRSARFFRSLFSWRAFRRVLIGLVGLITLIALFCTEESWRGKRAWEKYKREWEAKGEKFDWSAFATKPVPDDQNFLKTPFFEAAMDPKQRPQGARQKTDSSPTRVFPRPESYIDLYGGATNRISFGSFEMGRLTDLDKWQQFYRGTTNFPSQTKPQDPSHDVLIALSKFDPIRKELLEASQRPFAILPLQTDENLDALVSFFGAAKGLTVYLQLHATSCLAAGESDQALADIKLSYHLAETLKSNSVLLSHLVRIAILHISAEPIWEGLVQHRWNEVQLLELQKLVSSIDVLADYNLMMRGERAYGNHGFENERRRHFSEGGASELDLRLLKLVRAAGLVPDGIFYQNQIRVNRLFQEGLLAVVDPKQHRFFKDRYEAIERLPWLKPRTPYNMFARMLVPALTNSVAKAARSQTVLDEAIVGCALERYRLSNGTYPERLGELVPRFIEKLPADVMNGEPLKYRRPDDGGYVLYSVGWDLKDDGGVRRPPKNKGIATTGDEGDWVWICPGK